MELRKIMVLIGDAPPDSTVDTAATAVPVRTE
jgi:hypothetical protein